MEYLNLIKRAFNFIKKNGIIKSIKRLIVKIKIKFFNNSEDENYKIWIKENEPTKAMLNEQRNAKFNINPKISIIIPIYNTPENFFDELVDCLKNQTYSNWELCLADGSETPLEFMQKYLSDERIKYTTISENKGIAGNTNEALKLATGDYIGLLDHDDLLPVFSLYEVVKAINEHPDVEFIYTDEDKFEGTLNNRYGPFFKPDFSPYTLRSANYICHFSIFKKELMDKLQGFNSKYDGSQDFDIVIRASENTDKILHIPKILYHWRVHKNSTASGGDNVKPYAYEVAKNVIKDFLKRQNINSKVVDGKTLGSYEVKYIPNSTPLISIVIDANDMSKENVDKIVSNLKEATYKNIEILVITDKEEISKDYVCIKNSDTKAQTYNEAVSKLNGDYFIIIDSSYISVNTNDFLEQLLGITQNEEVAMVGTKLYDKEDKVLHDGIILGMNGIGDLANKGALKDAGVYMARLFIIHNVSAIICKYALITKECFEKVNGFDKDFEGLSMYIDLSLKLRELNKQIIVNPMIEFCIEELLNYNFDGNEIKEFTEKWNKVLSHTDPYFNPNLRTDRTNFSVKTYKVEV